MSAAFHAETLGFLCARVGVALGGVLLLLGGCSTPPPPPRSPGPVGPLVISRPAAPPVAAPARPVAPAEVKPPPPAPVPVPSPLVAESRWLAELFGATPVTVRDASDGSVELQVPMVHAFEPQAAGPKPAIKAVLDRMAQSLLRQPTSRLQMTVPAPAARAAALRGHLATRGIAGWRVGATTVGAEEASVTLRLQPGATTVRRLEDGSLPAPSPGTVTPPVQGSLNAGR